MEDGRFKLDDFEFYKVAREFRKRAYQLLKQLPLEENMLWAFKCGGQHFPLPTMLPKGMGAGTIKRTFTFAVSRAVRLTN